MRNTDPTEPNNPTRQDTHKMKTKVKSWKVMEDIDGAYVYPIFEDEDPNDAADNMAFGRVTPIAKLNEHAQTEIVSQFCAFISATAKTRKPRISRAMRLQREHERQSNAAAVRDGAI